MKLSLLLRRAALAAVLSVAPISVVRAVESAQICAGQTALGLPGWMSQAVIYEVNVRQYSPAGTFAAVTADLPRLQKLGVDVLWLMPIHPIGEINRKGPLGSYYAVKDYFGINPAYGTADDLHHLIDGAHARGMRVILDWVGNHTSWDNVLVQEHPDYYLRDRDGKFQPPTGFDWTDVIQLDFRQPGLLDYQAAAMLHWVKDFGVDGFRCDYATGVPTPFWDQLTARVRAVRPDAFFLAESELPQHQLKAFNASYGFDLLHAMNDVAQGHAPATGIDVALARSRVQMPQGGTLMLFTSSHDENSWSGTALERLGGGVRTFAVLSYMLNGIPMIYDGQEIGLNRRLEFFERDPIAWPASEPPLTAFYRTLNALRHTQPALRTGAPLHRIATTRDDALYCLVRTGADGSKVVALLNLTARDVTADAYDPALAGRWRDAFTGAAVDLTAGSTLELKAWHYRILVPAK